MDGALASLYCVSKDGQLPSGGESSVVPDGVDAAAEEVVIVAVHMGLIKVAAAHCQMKQ